jgi:UPF0716 protein FxsA
MPIGKLILLGLLGLVVAELAVFLMIARAFGTFVALTALLATSVLGMLVLARMGMRFAGRVADVLSRQDFTAAGTRSNGFLTTAGALLLVLPGFITDCIGLLLMIPAVQRWLIERAPPGRPRPAGRVLDLDRSQWHDLPDHHIGEDRDEPRKVPPKRPQRR